MSDKLSPEEYVEKKLRPIFNAMTQFVIKEANEDPVSFILILGFINVKFLRIL